MEFKRLPVDKDLELYVKNIYVFEHEDTDRKMLLPFFADGYPGIIYQQAPSGVWMKGKQLSDFYLYGQTIQPIELSIAGAFRLVVFQLYPFAVKALTGLNPRELNDDCIDLTALENVDAASVMLQLKNTTDLFVQKQIVISFLHELIAKKSSYPNGNITTAIEMIIHKKGNIYLKELREALHVTERSLERLFIAEIGVSPKQFIKIIQFNQSLSQLSDDAYNKLSDIAYENQYADQSHFIRTFKKFTGKTPSALKGNFITA